MPTEVNNTIIEHIFLRTNHTHQKKPQSYNFGNLFMQSKRKLCNSPRRSRQKTAILSIRILQKHIQTFINFN